MLVDFVPLLVDDYVGRNGIKIVLLAQLGAEASPSSSAEAVSPSPSQPAPHADTAPLSQPSLF